MTYMQRLVVNTLTFVAISVIFPQLMFVRSLWMAVLAAFVLSFLNALVKPILQVLSFPITLLTFGLFSFVINAVILKMTASLIGTHNFSFSSFGAALITTLIMAFVNMIISEHQLTKHT